jgi:ATP-dependent helicase HrpB
MPVPELSLALPIDPLIPEILGALGASRSVVLEAPPGAGKTTRVPPALLDLWPDGQVLVLEPRRIAAHLSAARVAEERGWTLGEQVGVQMRLHSICQQHTRLRYLTEGVLLRRLLAEPHLPQVRAVVLDEFHERHLHADLALALLRRLQLGPRPDLRVCIMSATLGETGARAARFLGDCPVLRAEGRAHEVTVSYLQQPSDRPLSREVRAGVLQLLREESERQPVAVRPGDVLVFLPGSAEIRRAAEDLAEVASGRGLQVLTLHGDMPLDAQRAAVVPRTPGAPRKVILATNVAETSITIPGVNAVIDSGLARVAGHSPWSGLSTLKVARICRAAAAQRAGRAGRTGPGRCLRLYTRHDHDTRPEFEVPELRRLDLAEAVLLLCAAGLDPAAVEFLDPPAPATLAAATSLLRRLGAVDGAGAITAEGAAMARLPLHPRQARILLTGASLGVAQDAAAAAALLGERDLRLQQRAGGQRQGAEASGPSDLLHLVDLLDQARAARFDPGLLRAQGLDPGAAQAAERARQKLLERGRSTQIRFVEKGDLGSPSPLLRAILAGYPDRVARRRARGRPEVLLCGGGAATLAEESVVRDAEFLVLLSAEEREGERGTLARLASAIEPDWLLDLPEAPISESVEPLWNAAAQRVEVVRRLLYEGLVLDESRAPGDGADPAQAALLLSMARAAPPGDLFDAEALERLRCRLAFLAAHCPEAGLPSFTQAEVDEALADLCQGRASFAALRQASLLDAVRERLDLRRPERAQKLALLAPEEVTLPGGRRVKVQYEDGQAPHIASRLQDFFGMARGPAVAGGKVPLVLHLLAPSNRPVQVTTDLSGFWVRHYPAIRRELCRRYPRHSWPEDPTTAAPPSANRK